MKAFLWDTSSWSVCLQCRCCADRGNAGVPCIMCGQQVSALACRCHFWRTGVFLRPPLQLVVIGLVLCGLRLRPKIRIFNFCLFGAESKSWLEDEVLIMLHRYLHAYLQLPFWGTVSQLCEHTEPCFLVLSNETLFSFTLTYPVMEIPIPNVQKQGSQGPPQR